MRDLVHQGTDAHVSPPRFGNKDERVRDGSTLFRTQHLVGFSGSRIALPYLSASRARWYALPSHAAPFFPDPTGLRSKMPSL